MRPPRALLQAKLGAKNVIVFMFMTTYGPSGGKIIRPFAPHEDERGEETMTTIEDITIRNDLRPGDLGYVVHLHGLLYGAEYGYGIAFEMYVAEGLHEFYKSFDPEKDRVWICEHRHRLVGFLLLMHRQNKAAQLRYFLIEPNYRGIGLGKKLMELCLEFLRRRQYQSSYLWTTHEQEAAASLYQRYGFILTEEKESTAFGKRLKEQRYDLRTEI